MARTAHDMPTQKITLKFLAQLLDLSRTTISIVLNDAPQAKTIAPKTRERILKAAKDYNYRPSFLGRSLNHGRSFLIGVISPDLSEGYTSSLLAGMEHALLESEYQFFISSHHWSKDRLQRTTQLFAERSVEGIIFVNSPFLPTFDLPSVHIGRHETDTPGTSMIVDNHRGIELAMEHLIELGHRKLAFIRGHEGSADSADRWDAVLSVARKHGIKIQPRLVAQLERLGNLSISAIEEGARCAEQLMPHRGKFTALMSFNDMSAIGAINAFRAAQWDIPGELSIVGFDDVVEARICFPALTTVRQPLQKMGEAAAREIIARIESGTSRRTVTFHPELVVRASTVKPPS